jgi:cephalosporin hydroxylase
MGVPVQKNPCDLWVYQEIIWRTKPTLIIETGTQTGGSAFFFGSMLDWIGEGSVISVDVAGVDVWPGRPAHPRVAYLHGDSTDRHVVDTIFKQAQDQRVMVVLDSDHAAEHVETELELYGPMVTKGCYMVLEDTHPCTETTAAEALEPFLDDHPEFQVDEACEAYLLTFHPGGWLMRVL